MPYAGRCPGCSRLGWLPACRSGSRGTRRRSTAAGRSGRAVRVQRLVLVLQAGPSGCLLRLGRRCGLLERRCARGLLGGCELGGGLLRCGCLLLGRLAYCHARECSCSGPKGPTLQGINDAPRQILELGMPEAIFHLPETRKNVSLFSWNFTWRRGSELKNNCENRNLKPQFPASSRACSTLIILKISSPFREDVC